MELTAAVPWNSVELRVHQFRWHEQFHGIPWNSMELGVRQFRWQEQFHGIPWNLEYANFNDTNSSMEFHGTKSAPISLTRAVPWNFMELKVCQFRWHQKSMENAMRQFHWHEQFHGIPWNSMEFGVRQFRWHEQFHGIPWNSMELGVRQFRWQEQFNANNRNGLILLWVYWRKRLLTMFPFHRSYFLGGDLCGHSTAGTSKDLSQIVYVYALEWK